MDAMTADARMPTDREIRHGGDEDLEPVSFRTTVTFVPQGSKTMVTMLAVFPTAKSFVVDSSKMPKRLSYLMRLEEPDVYPCISSATQGAESTRWFASTAASSSTSSAMS